MDEWSLEPLAAADDCTLGEAAGRAATEPVDEAGVGGANDKWL